MLDLAIFRSIPHVQVFDPGDAVEFAAILEYSLGHEGPVYIRSNKGKHGVFHKPEFSYNPGKAEVLHEGSDIGIITTGISTLQGIRACEILENIGINARHIHMPCIKPVDREEIAYTASVTGKIVTVENHSVNGGLGSAVAEVLCEEHPAMLRRLGFQDCFGETAKLDYLQHVFGIDCNAIVSSVKAFLDS